MCYCSVYKVTHAKTAFTVKGVGYGFRYASQQGRIF